MAAVGNGVAEPGGLPGAGGATCPATLAAGFTLVAGATNASSAAAQLYVMESTVAAIRVGSAFDMNATIALPAGSYIRAGPKARFFWKNIPEPVSA